MQTQTELIETGKPQSRIIDSIRQATQGQLAEDWLSYEDHCDWHDTCDQRD